jgi:hypothetical protein
MSQSRRQRRAMERFYQKKLKKKMAKYEKALKRIEKEKGDD